MEYYDRLFSMVRNFVEYGNYQRNPEKAIQLLWKKYFPNKPKEECAHDFNTCCSAYTDAIGLVKTNELHYKQYYSNPQKTDLPIEAEMAYRKLYPTVPEKLLNSFIGWTYHWHCER
jgi:hypothetical protein